MTRTLLLRASAGLAAVALLSGCAPAMTAGAAAAGGMNDPQIVAIMMASNNGEITTSQPATSRATSQAVRDYAQRMITEHTAANQQLQALGIAPEENSISRALASTASQTVQALNTYSGAAFDRTYMDAQVAMHRWTLNSLDNSLIPGARSGRLRAQLQTMRTAVAAHLEQAEQIRSGLR